MKIYSKRVWAKITLLLLHLRRLGRLESNLAILEDHRLGGVQPQLISGQEIDRGIRLLFGDDVAREDWDLLPDLPGEHGVHYALYGALVTGGAHADFQSSFDDRF